MSFTSVDLPEPLTPDTATKAPNGNETSIFCKLFSRAPFTTRLRLASISRRFLGTSIFVRPDK